MQKQLNSVTSPLVPILLQNTEEDVAERILSGIDLALTVPVVSQKNPKKLDSSYVTTVVEPAQVSVKSKKVVPVRFMKETLQFCEMLDTYGDGWITSFQHDPKSEPNPFTLQVNRGVWQNYLNRVHNGEEVQIVMVGGCTSWNVPVVFTS